MDDFQIESYDDQQLVIDPKEREEMRIMNKLMIFDNFVEENETKVNFITISRTMHLLSNIIELYIIIIMFPQ